jgi:hypothetical protein
MPVRRPEKAGPLSGHVREGRRYLPEFVATGVLEMQDWVRDDLPDLLWPALVLAHYGTEAGRRFVDWQRNVQQELEHGVGPKLLGECLDGRLTSLDRLVGHHPESRVVILENATELGLLPRPVVDALSTYPERPGKWLMTDQIRSPTQDDLDLISRGIGQAIEDGHRESIIKCLSIWSAVQAGTFTCDATMRDLLKIYPTDMETRGLADTVVRASWGATKGAMLASDESRFDQSARWAKMFWDLSSARTMCVRKRGRRSEAEEDEGEMEDDSVATTLPDDPQTSQDGENLQGLATDLVSSYIEALETAPALLYDQEPQEVHAGLVYRAGREVIAALGSRDVWCIENGSHVARVLVEVRIYLSWMAAQDPSIYRRYQDFGRGKAKLYSRILDELPAEARTPDFGEAINEFDRLSHNDGGIDHRVVDTSDSFAGKSIRAMAGEVGLLDFYRRSYYVASGVSHSEWWSVELHAMEQCRNVLHRGHLIPSLTLNSGAEVELARSWVDQLYALIHESLRVLGTDASAVSEAFAWLEGEPPPSGPTTD